MRLDRDGMREFYDDEMPDRKQRPLGDDRERRLTAFVDECLSRGVRRVLEVGCGAGRDGLPMQDAGLEYTGIDLSPVAVEICRKLGLTAREALATALPFDDASFEAAWTMSTLMRPLPVGPSQGLLTRVPPQRLAKSDQPEASDGARRARAA